MSLPTEAVTSPGSGLTFINYYNDGVTDAFRGAILTAERMLQGLFTDATTVGIRFDLRPLDNGTAGHNAFDTMRLSYGQLVGALQAHATSQDDLAAVAGLPATDPSNGVGFSVATAQARILGLAVQSNTVDDTVELNSNIGFSFGQDAVGVLLHEITEGVFGRVGSLGIQATRWLPMDLFRFTAGGQRDYTGGADGVPTFFGTDSAHVSSIAYHNAVDASGHDDGSDLADWNSTRGDAFGPFTFGQPGVLTPLDLQVLDILGWRPSSAGPYVPPADDFASGLADTASPFGDVAPGGSVAGALQAAGDRDWFRVTLQAGSSYTINLIGKSGGGGDLADPFLRLRDAAGVVLTSNDDAVSGSQPDSRVVFTPTASGTYYVEAGGFVDGYTGSYRLQVSGGGAAAQPTTGDDVLVGAAGGATISALAGADTITGGNGANYLRGDEGDDIINGGTAFDDINGNMGADTLHGSGGDDWVVGGKDNDVIFGDDGNDVVLGNLGDDSLTGGGGADIVRGGQSNDVVNGGAGDDYVSGDRGDDTVIGGAGADMFHSFGDAGLDRVLDFSLAEGDRLLLDPGTTFSLAQMGADTVISMDGGAQVILVGISLSSLPSSAIIVG